jgi:hypothetical protein
VPPEGLTTDQVMEVGSNSLSGIDRFLVLPHEEEGIPEEEVPKTTKDGEPVIDYSKSIILTSETFMAAMAAKAARKEVALEESRRKRAQLEESKVRRNAEKEVRDATARKRATERAEKKQLEDYWKRVKDAGWGDPLHQMIKNTPVNQGSPSYAPYSGSAPPICRYNQKIAMLRRSFKKQGRDPRSIIPTVRVGSQLPWFGPTGLWEELPQAYEAPRSC